MSNSKRMKYEYLGVWPTRKPSQAKTHLMQRDKQTSFIPLHASITLHDGHDSCFVGIILNCQESIMSILNMNKFIKSDVAI